MTLTASIAAIALYCAGLHLRWRQREQTVPNRVTLAITLGALTCHGFAAFTLINSSYGLDLSVVPVSVLVAFIIVAVVAVANIRLPVENLYLFLFPISIVVLLAANLIEPGGEPLDSLSGGLLPHILLSLAAYSVLMMTACQSILLALQERRLRHPGEQAFTILPPLETMERLHLVMLWIGLSLLSASILSGFVFLEDVFARQVLHHVVLTSLAWLVYLVFLSGHYLYGWRGMTSVKWSLSGFSLLLLGYLGSKFVVEYLLTR
ncbi:MAG: cytochrome c biogenesis protein CcsA [Pseudomonadaceae bacterium]|nr:cytochrome c biogenesis protein CcsA [Pseudomonadaceae bacterium]